MVFTRYLKKKKKRKKEERIRKTRQDIGFSGEKENRIYLTYWLVHVSSKTASVSMARNVGEKKKIDGRRKIQRKIKKKKKKIKKSERTKEKNIYSRGSVKRFSFYARFFLFFSFLFLFFFFFFSPPLFLQCPRNNAISSPLYLFFFSSIPCQETDVHHSFFFFLNTI